MISRLILATALLWAPVAVAQQAVTDPVPAGDPPSWITQNDYPSRAKAKHEQGDTGFRLEVDATGRVSGCTITASSGSALLDGTTCAAMRMRARFKPAQDAAGNKVAGSWSSVFHWRLDDD
jgi:protein TonB